MSIDRQEELERLKEVWDERAKRFDEWLKTFAGSVEYFVDWELLQKYLPKTRNAKILDAAGGTGRITLPLAKLGYSVTLCDISPGMLEVARQKILNEGVSNKVKISECDLYDLPFPDESFDFVICWDGIYEIPKELIRVTKKGGRISFSLINKCRGAIDQFSTDPNSAIELIYSHIDYVYHHEQKHKALTPKEARTTLEALDIRVLDVCGVCHWLDVLKIPEEVRNSHEWDQDFFKQTIKMVLKLSTEPSVIGMSKHLIVYGEKK